MQTQDFSVMDSESETPRLKTRLSAFCRRELIAYGAAIVFAVVATVFIVFYATKTSEKKSVSSTPCSTLQCLFTATYALEVMDPTVDPCSDFYQYACGSWAKIFPTTADHNSVNERVTEANLNRLAQTLEDTNKVFISGSAEQKLQRIFRACIDDYARSINSGKVLIDRVIDPSGGSYLLQEDWNSTSWDFQRALSMARAEFEAEVLFSFVVAPDTIKSLPIIHVSVSGSTYPPYTNQKFIQVGNAFERLLRAFGDQLIKDSDTTLTPDMVKSRLDTFVDDIMMVEKFLANVTEYELLELPSKKQVSLKSLTSLMNHTVDMTSLLREMYPSPAPIGPDVKVSVTNVKSVRMLGEFLLQLHRDNLFARVMNNFLVYRFMKTYMLDLSVLYINAAREYIVEAGIGNQIAIRSQHHCLTIVRHFMDDAVTHMFMRDDHLKENAKQAAKMAELAKKGALQTIADVKTMEPTIREALLDTINGATMKIGYPKWISQTSAVDKHYESLTVADNHFDNLLSLNSFHRKELARKLAPSLPREPYSWDVISPLITTLGSHVMIVPAGMLQVPLYDRDGPMYANQGGVGEQLAEGLYKIFFPVYYGVTSKDPPLAADESLYQALKCFGNYLKDVILGPFIVDGKVKMVKVPAIARSKVDLLRHHWGMRAALKAYIDWENTNGKENKTTGLLSFSNHKLFFLKAVQSYCESTKPLLVYAQANRGLLPRKWIINRVLANLPEFGRTFNCKIGSPMNRAEKCDYV